MGRLGASWSRPGATLGRSLAVLGASWGVLGHLGGVLGASWGILEAFRDKFIEKLQFLIDFCFQLRSPKPKKTLIFHWFYKYFRKNRSWKLTSIFYVILVSVWFDFGFIFAVLGGSGGILGRLGRVLAPLGGLLGRLWPVLRASWRILGRLGCVLARLWRDLPRLGAMLSRKTSQHKPVLASEREARLS